MIFIHQWSEMYTSGIVFPTIKVFCSFCDVLKHAYTCWVGKIIQNSDSARIRTHDELEGADCSHLYNFEFRVPKIYKIYIS